jgi:CO/xanthine dehydrogenase FAD-binding subunit
MKPAPLKYIAASSLDHALRLKKEYGGEASFLAGGQSLIPTMNFRLAQPGVLIDINPLSEFAGVSAINGTAVRIGALTRYRMLEREPLIADAVPLMAEALPHIAHPQIRNRGTLGGNLAHADPASEMPAIVTVLGGRLRAQSVDGERWIEAPDFFVGPLTTSLRDDEMLVEIELPAHARNSGSCFMEVARRRGDFAMVGIALTLSLSDAGRCNKLRIALCGAGETPVDASDAASGLIGQPVDEDEIDAVAASVQQSIDPPGNLQASKEFQRHLAGVLVKRALRIALERAWHD